MSDRELIVDVIVRYATGIDSRDWKLFRTCFTEDCQVDYGVMGRWTNREEIARFMERSHSGPSQHRMSNFVIDVGSDRARARTYLDALVYGPGGWGGAHAIGYYDDELIRTSEGWRIARRRYTSVSMKFLGLLSVIPASLALRLAAFGTRRLNAAAVGQKN